MTYQIATPYCILPEGCYCSPNIGSATEDDRLFIVTNDVTVRESLIEALNDRLAKRRRLSPTLFNETLEDALTSLGQRNKQCDLAFLLMHPGGCLVAQMGRSRVLHISGTSHEIAYDSRNQILDYTTKSRAEVIKNIDEGDVIIITLSDRVDSHKLMQTVADYSHSEEFNDQINKALSVNLDAAPASYVITLRKSKGSMLSPLADVNWKWIIFYLLLIALIIVVAMFSLNGSLKLPKIFNSSPAIETPIDSVPADTTVRDSLTPAVEVPAEVSPVEKSQPDTTRVVKPKPIEPTTNEEIINNPSLHETVPVAKPELHVDEPTAPPVTPTPSSPEPIPEE